MAFDGTLWGRRVQLTGITPVATATGFVGLITADNIPVEAMDGGALSGLNGGGDLRVSTDNAGANQIPLEVVNFVVSGTPSLRQAQLWVRFPSYEAASRSLWLFYNRAGQTQPPVTDPFGRNAIRRGNATTGFTYHLEELATDPFPQFLDSTGGSDGIQNGIAPATGSVTGQIGNAIEYNGLNESIRAVQVPERNFGTSDFSVGSWIFVEPAADQKQERIVNDRGRGVLTGNTGWQFKIIQRGTGWSFFDCAISDGTNTTQYTGQGTIFNHNEWYFVTMTYERSTRQMRLSVNGVEDVLFTNGSTIGNIDNTLDLVIGASRYNAGVLEGSTQVLTGATDEVWGVNTLLDQNFLALTYNNQNSPSTFWTTGTPEDTGGTSSIVVTGQTADYSYSATDGQVSLIGLIAVNGSTASYDYKAVDGNVKLTSIISVEGQTANYNYEAITGSVTLSPPDTIVVTGQTAEYDYNAIDGSVVLMGTISVQGDTASYDYSAVNGTISIRGAINVQPDNVLKVRYTNNTLRVRGTNNILRVR